MANILTGQHFGTEGNRAKLMAAMDRGLISEPQYKTMSGYDASQEIGLTPLSTFLTSGSYNLGKRIRSPGDFEGKIGPWDSTMLNVQGSKGLGFDKNQYEGPFTTFHEFICSSVLKLLREALCTLVVAKQNLSVRSPSVRPKNNHFLSKGYLGVDT